MEEGLTAQTQRHFAAAAQIFGQLVEQRPDWVRAWIELGHALHGQGKLLEAEEALRTALDLDPRRQEVHLRLGELLGRELGALDDAREHLDTAHRLDPHTHAGARAAALLGILAGRQAS